MVIFRYFRLDVEFASFDLETMLSYTFYPIFLVCMHSWLSRCGLHKWARSFEKESESSTNFDQVARSCSCKPGFTEIPAMSTLAGATLLLNWGTDAAMANLSLLAGWGGWSRACRIDFLYDLTDFCAISNNSDSREPLRIEVTSTLLDSLRLSRALWLHC